LALLDAAVIAMAIGIFEAQTHLWTIFLQVEKLLAVEGPTTFLSNELDSILVLHSTFYHGKSNQNRSSPQSRYTVDSNAAAWLLPKLQFEQVQPIINNLVGGRSAVVKRPIQNLDPLLPHQGCIISGLTYSDNGGDAILLQLLNEFIQGGIGGIMGDEEPHVFVGDFHWSRSVHTSHRDNELGGREEEKKHDILHTNMNVNT